MPNFYRYVVGEMKTFYSNRQNTRMYIRYLTLLLLLFVGVHAMPQSATWQLWAEGLQQGVYPRMTVAPNHDIYYSLLGAPPPRGLVYKSNTQKSSGDFISLPPIPGPLSWVNNVMFVVTNQKNEPIAGLYRNDLAEPWLFRLDANDLQWFQVNTDIPPNLGGQCGVRTKKGTIWIGARWSCVYKSTDDGLHFKRICEDSSIAAAYPCYYPTWNGSSYDGAIFSINADHQGKIFVGTETGGIVYTEDEGASWHPVDYHPCQDNNSALKDSSSLMKALSLSGNAGAIGFTRENNLVWNGANMWGLNWPNTLGFADLKNHTTRPLIGIPQYLVTVGQQVTSIVTASNGQMFLHSGGSTNAPEVGIYTSMDGIHWSPFNTGITGLNDHLSQGSLAVDSNMVFFATRDGKVWRYIVPETTGTDFNDEALFSLTIAPHPIRQNLVAKIFLSHSKELTFSLYDLSGKPVYQSFRQLYSSGNHSIEINLQKQSAGIYCFIAHADDFRIQKNVVISSSDR